MKASTVVPGRPYQVRVDEMAEPPESEGGNLVQGRPLGVCGTDDHGKVVVDPSEEGN